MPVLLLKYCALLLFMATYSCQNSPKDFEISELTYHLPFGVAQKDQTTFSWKIKSKSNHWTQGAYQILVATSEENINNTIGDYWDSGEILSDNQLYIPYKGKTLMPGEKYYWKVKVWEKNGKEYRWSDVKSFDTPLNYPQNWKAQWITYDYKKEAPMPLLRKAFQLKNYNKAISARLYICGLGYYEAYFNGSKIGDRVLEPAQTNYEDYAFYTAYDVPIKEIKQENTLGIMPGNGWFNQWQVWSPSMAYGQPVAIAQLIIKYKNEKSDTISTDETWKWKNGPVISNNIYAGEVYDANLEVADWCKYENDEKGWKPVNCATTFPPQLVEQTMEPIRRMTELPAISIMEPSAKTYVFDFGQNFAGWARLKINGQKGQKITLRFSEEISPNKNIDPASTGVFATKYVQTDQYICKGKGTEIWEPRFTYHGFRYVEVTGMYKKPDLDLLTGIVVYSSMKKSGDFSCSDPQINQLHDMALWTIKSNVHGIPTDCPHRERCGWTGDAHTLAPTLIRNFDARFFLTKYLYDLRSSARDTKKELYFGVSFNDRSIVTKPAGVPTMIVPGKRTSGIASPDWGTATTQIPWNLYQYYGDINILREFYPDMKTWVDYISEKFPDYIVMHGLGDWCPPGGNKMIDCPVPLSSTAFHYLDLSILAKTAYLFGYSSDASFYSKRMNKVKQRFNEQFFDPIKNTYGSQTANAMAIQLGLVPDGKIQDVAQSIVQDITNKTNNFIQTGIFGLGRIFPALAENGAEDLAFSILTKTGNHSFANMWEKFGATTLWEILPVDDVLSNEDLNKRSHSHPMNAGYDEWFFKGIAGIHQDEKSPGFKNIVFRPYFISKLKNASGSYESPYGTIVSKWKREEETFKWEIEIPANSGADIYIPKVYAKQHISINGKDANSIVTEDPLFPDYYFCKSVGSGLYAVIVEKDI